MASFVSNKNSCSEKLGGSKIGPKHARFMSPKLISRKNLSGRKFFDFPHFAYATFSKELNFYKKNGFLYLKMHHFTCLQKNNL